MARTADQSLPDHGFAPAGHDHRACLDEALAAADAVCAARGVRLTPLRRRVLELVWENHKPVGAYAASLPSARFLARKNAMTTELLRVGEKASRWLGYEGEYPPRD